MEITVWDCDGAARAREHGTCEHFSPKKHARDYRFSRLAIINLN